jgi:hypothetical protein
VSKRIASREFKNEKTGRRIVADVYAPRQVSDQEWACRYVIRGLPGRRQHDAHGIDSLQALSQAMQGIRYYLERSGLPISFLGQLGDFGIYRAVAGWDTAMTRRLERLVEREFTKLVRAKWRRVVVDGETFYWTAYPSKQQTDGGPWEPIEYLTVSRAPNTAGIGAVHPAGTRVTEAHAIEVIELVRAHGRTIP